MTDQPSVEEFVRAVSKDPVAMEALRAAFRGKADHRAEIRVPFRMPEELDLEENGITRIRVLLDRRSLAAGFSVVDLEATSSQPAIVAIESIHARGGASMAENLGLVIGPHLPTARAPIPHPYAVGREDVEARLAITVRPGTSPAIELVAVCRLGP